ncbi:MAG: hypothetical protein ACHBN1_14050 [Heteroscytonema crispum UTEX LB 1556]
MMAPEVNRSKLSGAIPRPTGLPNCALPSFVKKPVTKSLNFTGLPFWGKIYLKRKLLGFRIGHFNGDRILLTESNK